MKQSGWQLVSALSGEYHALSTGTDGNQRVFDFCPHLLCQKAFPAAARAISHYQVKLDKGGE